MKVTITLTVKEMYIALPKSLQDLCGKLSKNLVETSALSLEEAQTIFIPLIFSAWFKGEKEKAPTPQN